MPIVHPNYGYCVPGFKLIPGFDGYTVNEHGIIKNKYQKQLKWAADGRIALAAADGTKRVLKKITHCILLAHFPSATTNETVDHLDENPKNNHVTNLFWCSRSDNSSKSMRLRPRQIKDSSNRRKAIWLLQQREGERVTKFSSILAAADAFGVDFSNVRRAALSNGKWAVGGWYFVYDEIPDLDGETWKTSPALDVLLGQMDVDDAKKFKVSNRGRVLTSRGCKTRGRRHPRASPKVRFINTGGGKSGKTFMVHQLVFAGFHDQLPPKKGQRNENGAIVVICHNDEVPLDEDGCYRNWPIDLRLDTQSENKKEHDRVAQARAVDAMYAKQSSTMTTPQKDVVSKKRTFDGCVQSLKKRPKVE